MFSEGEMTGLGYLRQSQRTTWGNFEKGIAEGICVSMDKSVRSLKFGVFKNGKLNGFGTEITPLFTFKGKFDMGKAT